MIRRIYNWMMDKAGDKRAPWALAVVSFIESSFFPIPPDIMLIPMVLSRREKAWWYATIATVASVLGGLLGYAIGYFAYQAIGLPILEFYGKEHALDGFIAFVHNYGVPAVIIKGMTPIPYKVVTIAAGVAHMDLLRVHWRQHHRARDALLSRCRAPVLVRPADPRVHRAPLEPRHDHLRRALGRRLRCH